MGRKLMSISLMVLLIVGGIFVFVTHFLDANANIDKKRVESNLKNYGYKYIDWHSSSGDLIDENNNVFLGEDRHHKLIMKTNNGVQYYISVRNDKIGPFGDIKEQDVETNFYRKYGEYLFEQRFGDLFEKSKHYYYFVTGLNDENFRQKLLNEARKQYRSLKMYMEHYEDEIIRDGFDFAYILKLDEPIAKTPVDQIKKYYKEYLHLAQNLKGFQHKITISTKNNADSYTIESEKPITLSQFRNMFYEFDSKKESI